MLMTTVKPIRQRVKYVGGVTPVDCIKRGDPDPRRRDLAMQASIVLLEAGKESRGLTATCV